MKGYVGILYVEETKFGPRKYCVSFHGNGNCLWIEDVIDDYHEDTIDNLVCGLADAIPEPIKLMQISKRKHIDNVILRPFNAEEIQYFRAQSREQPGLAIKITKGGLNR